MMTAHIEYARALFMLSEEEGISDGVLSELEALDGLLAENPSYVNLLDTPAVPKDEKLELIDRAFADFCEILKNLFKILTEKRSVRLIPGIKREFLKLYDESRNIERVEAITAVPMKDAQIEALRNKLSHGGERTVIISNTVSPEILGGMKLRYAGVQLDSSLRTELDKLEAKLKELIV